VSSKDVDMRKWHWYSAYSALYWRRLASACECVGAPHGREAKFVSRASNCGKQKVRDSWYQSSVGRAHRSDFVRMTKGGETRLYNRWNPSNKSKDKATKDRLDALEAQIAPLAAALLSVPNFEGRVQTLEAKGRQFADVVEGLSEDVKTPVEVLRAEDISTRLNVMMRACGKGER
jgi:hypothetical protein